MWGLAETLRLELADDGIGVSVIFPSGMMSRHLETSEAAQPDHLRRPIADDGDFDAMIASNPEMAAMLATPEDAAGRRDRGASWPTSPTSSPTAQRTRPSAACRTERAPRTGPRPAAHRHLRAVPRRPPELGPSASSAG